MHCRHCNKLLRYIFLDLGEPPPSNAYVEPGEEALEKTYPLKVLVCDECWLVQTQDFTSADELFKDDYAYFSSVSATWLHHAKSYVESISDRLALNSKNFVVEIASNDGYLLKNFLASGVPCLGIEPTKSTANAAKALGIDVYESFFGEKSAIEVAKRYRLADLIIANNVLAHVPDINDFVLGIKCLLNKGGVVTFEFHHFLELLINKQFDTIYHEHFSYLSLVAVVKILERAGLKVWDVEQIKTHGGSLRVYTCHIDDSRVTLPSVGRILEHERQLGICSLDTYVGFQSQVDKMVIDLREFLLEKKMEGKKVVAYGAAAKGNTLLNYAKIDTSMLAYVCDKAESKQGKLMPGSHLPILSPDILMGDNIDYVLVLPWNIADEIKSQLSKAITSKNTKFIKAIPKLVEV